MTEPETQKREKSAFFTRKRLVEFVISIIVSAVVGSLVDIALHSEKRAELASFRASAYTTIAQFAPWNVARRYVQIVVTQGNEAAEQLAEQQQRQADLFRGFACSVGGVSGGSDNPCATSERPHGIQAFYLSAHVPLVFRPITAFFDLLLHALIDQGFVGFIVGATQLALGVFLTRIAVHRGILKLDSFYSYILILPLTVLAVGSVAALPLWLLAFIGVTVFKGLPAAGLGAQLGGTGYLARWFGSKAVEEFGHAAIMKQVKRAIGD